MCGIAGLASLDRRIEASTLQSMNTVLHHRGPDDRGVWVGGDEGVSVGLAHTRLSIIDLSPAGHQPMTNEDGSIWLTYNGEIYNHAEVRRDLERAGHRYRSHSDSETILHAYEEWGDACVDRFRGMFAFAIWDGRQRRLLIARDRLGVKPLYYAVRGTTVVFASEIKAILRSGLVTPAITPGALPEYLTFGYLAGEGTLFAGIRKLPPAHVMVWSDGAVRESRYWQLRFEPKSDASAHELQAEFRSLFEEAVRLRLMSDVPLGVFLSGGLDSSAIAAEMGRQVAEPIKTFSVGYEPRYYSEFSYARQVATQIGAHHHEIILTADEFYNAVPSLVWHEDEPMWGTASVALYFVSRLAARHVKVVLTGEGSDELFGGYDRYWMTAWNVRAMTAFGVLPRAVRTGVRQLALNGPWPERVRRALGHTCLRHEVMPDGLFFENWFGVLPPAAQTTLAGPSLLAELRGADVYATHRQLYESPHAASLIDRLLYTDVHSNLVELLMKQDQMSMATSIESRVPFLDHKLVEFAGRVPAGLKISGRSGKQLVKDALAGYLPESILHRPKQGFPVPWESWLNESFAPRIEALLLEPRALDRGWFEPRGLRALFAAHRSGRVNRSRQIWALWGLELWARAFLDGDADGAEPTSTGASLQHA